jgi:UDP-glucose 4-epimerase
MKILVTGAAGFVGSNFCERMVNAGHSVMGIDNLSTGEIPFIKDLCLRDNFNIHFTDIVKDQDELTYLMSRKIDMVYHFAANADVRHGLEHPYKDLEQNTIGTLNVLEAMRKNNVHKIMFASTGSIYGNAETPTIEDTPLPIQKSLYGASKLAAEGLIQAYCEAYEMESYIFRFVSLLGQRYSHGHVFDFVKALLENPSELHILGNGNQYKSYLHISDCIEGILTCVENSYYDVNIFNLGQDYGIIVKESAAIICDEMNVNPVIYVQDKHQTQGWIGDIPRILLDTTRAQQMGWKPKYSIEESIRETVRWLLENKWILGRKE